MIIGCVKSLLIDVMVGSWRGIFQEQSVMCTRLQEVHVCVRAECLFSVCRHVIPETMPCPSGPERLACKKSGVGDCFTPTFYIVSSLTGRMSD